MAESLNKIGKTCKDVGIEATYHFFYPGHVVKNKALLEKLCELTDPDLVRLTIDNGHLTWAGIDPVEIIKAYKNRINVAHLKNLRSNEFVEFGEEGTVDFSEIIRSLKSTGFEGWAIVDNESVSTTVFESALKAKRYIEKHLT
jgi:inosose dehydratase